MDYREYYTSEDVLNTLRIHTQTLYRWRKEGKVKFIKLSPKKFLYKKSDIDFLLNIKNEKKIPAPIKKNIIYTRVSNHKQRSDLDKQKQILTDYCNINGVIPDLIFSEVASGMNENRLEFNKLLDLVVKNEVDTIYITYKDRLTRFGFDYFTNLFNKFNTKIVVLNNPIDEENLEQELTEDLISIIHHFSMKMYSNRRKQLKDIQKQLEK